MLHEENLDLVSPEQIQSSQDPPSTIHHRMCGGTHSLPLTTFIGMELRRKHEFDLELAVGLLIIAE
jgi:hypothetical protein